MGGSVGCRVVGGDGVGKAGADFFHAGYCKLYSQVL